MNNSFEHMQKLAFGRVVTETKKEVLTENALKARIKELVHSSLGEAKKKKKEEDIAPQEDVDLEMSATEEMPEDTMAPESTNGADINPTVKSIQDSLQKAFAQAKTLGDAKLVTQIGNTLTMLLRDQVLGQQVNETMDENNNFEQWKEELYNLVMKEADMERYELAINEKEIQEYYNEGKTPSEVYFDIWQQDAGNFWGI